MTADASEQETEYAYRVLEIMNQTRAENGLDALAVTQRLMDTAQLRAREIAVFYSHTRPDGTICNTAYDQNGVNYLIGVENIAYGYDSPESVMEAWMNSPAHRENILSANIDWHYIGVGCFITDSCVYWSQNFIN